MTQKHSVHAFVATVVFKGGSERDVHYDQLQCVRHGFFFQRVDETAEFISADLIDSIAIVKAVTPMGSA